MSKEEKKILEENTVLQKGRQGAMRVVYGRTAVIALLFVSQILLMVCMVNFFGRYIPMAFGGYMVFALCIVLVIINKEESPETKLMWTIITMLLPLVGGALYLYVKMQPGYRFLEKRLNSIYKQTEV